MQGNQINFAFFLGKSITMGLVGRTVKGQEGSLCLLSTEGWQRDFDSSAASEIALLH